MESPEERERVRSADAEREYREAVLESRSDAWKWFLFSAGLLVVAAVVASGWLTGGEGGGEPFIASSSLLTVAFVQLLMYDNIRAWMPRAYEDGFLPNRRTYLDALSNRTPARRPWEVIESVAVDAYSVEHLLAEKRGQPKRLTIVERTGRKWTLYRNSHPAAFDDIIRALAARGLVEPPTLSGMAEQRAAMQPKAPRGG